MMIEEKTIVLRKPVMLGDVTHAEVNLREPTAGEMSKATRHGGGNNIDVVISLISQIAKLPMSAVNQFSQRDFAECSDFLASFTTAGQETGEM
ncbi:phage tail assembly protein [Janthinobacterium sp.]|uniref:phage tail assembly protein n=1 Tax=Janthinobacterium sp. TaxID=1871054 RepID=UPI00293D3BD4|nr:phage tail assembly protein [Janthinobacterium sp.]